MATTPKIHHVDSKEHMLSESDILLVTAHDLKITARKAYKEAGSPPSMSPERVLYTVMGATLLEPGVLKIREGNTLFGVVPMTENSAVCLMYNADTLERTKDNLTEICRALNKMGYDRLMGPLAVGEIGHGKVVDIYKQVAKENGWKLRLTPDQVEVEF